MALERPSDRKPELSGRRFVVQGNTCFVKLLTQGPVSVGLVLQGESQLEQFCKEAIEAYKELVRNKMSTKQDIINDLGKVDDDSV